MKSRSGTLSCTSARDAGSVLAIPGSDSPHTRFLQSRREARDAIPTLAELGLGGYAG
jgi:hypothetical protein